MGYLPSKINDAKQYDYICCRDLNGIIRKKDELVLNKHYFYINREDIANVLFIGFNDDRFNEFEYLVFQIKDSLADAKENNISIDREKLIDLCSKSFMKFVNKFGDVENEK